MVLLEGLILLFILHIFWPTFPYIRFVVFGASTLILIQLLNLILNPGSEKVLFEAVWMFIVQDIVSVLPV